jgi:hypothetical protein
VTKDLNDNVALMRQQNSRTNGLRMGADQRGNIILRAVWNVKIDFIDFVDENVDVDDDDYDFVSMGNRHEFGQN